LWLILLPYLFRLSDCQNCVKGDELHKMDQGVNGLPVASIARTGDTVKLDMKAVGCSYEGTLSKDASAMTGTFSQGGGSIPLNLQRKKAETKN
jgi:hypothetical protein